MQVIITGITDPDRPILAIKGVRMVTGLGLREAKAVVDSVRDGLPQSITVPSALPESSSRPGARVEDVLREHGLMFVMANDGHITISALRKMPRHLTVQDVLDVAYALGL